MTDTAQTTSLQQDRIFQRSQICSELHGQQVKGEDSAPPLCSGETLPGVLCPALEPSAQERHGPVGVGPEEGHKNDLRAGTPLL